MISVQWFQCQNEEVHRNAGNRGLWPSSMQYYTEIKLLQSITMAEECRSEGVDPNVGKMWE